MKVTLRFVEYLLTEDNTCSVIYDVAMVSHSLPSVPPRWSSPHGRSVCFAIVISGVTRLLDYWSSQAGLCFNHRSVREYAPRLMLSPAYRPCHWHVSYLA